MGLAMEGLQPRQMMESKAKEWLGQKGLRWYRAEHKFEKRCGVQFSLKTKDTNGCSRK